MALTFTAHTLDKLEQLFKTLGYKVRYEKGNFKTNACVIDKSRVIVVNKFANLESKIQSLVELVQQLEDSDQALDEKQKQFYYSLKQTTLEL